MNVLSITFHATNSIQKEWKDYVKETLVLMAENLMDAEKYIVSEVESNMITEGSNTNLLLVFEDDQKRGEFLDSELKNIEERIAAKFGDQVMIFVTTLNPLSSRL